MHMLPPLAKVMLGMLGAYLVVRVGDLTVRGAWGNAFSFGLVATLFWLEMVLFCLPFVLVGTAEARRNPARLFLGGCRLMLGGSLLRINGFLIGYDTGRAGTTSRRFPRSWSPSACSPSKFWATSSLPAGSRCCRAKKRLRPTEFQGGNK